MSRAAHSMHEPPIMMRGRYSRVAASLHWLMAVMVLAMLCTGLAMSGWLEMTKPDRFALFQWHKSLGVLLLWVIALRLIWRLWHRPPALPAAFKNWEVRASHMTHRLLYLLMIAMPLSGWLMVSASSYGLPTIVYGWFEWPHIPGLEGNDAVEENAEFAHWLMAWALIGLIALHMGAWLKHWAVDGINLLPRMRIGKF